MPGGDRAAERPGVAGGVKAALLVGVAGSPADPHHDLAAGDKGGDQGAPAQPLLLGDGQGRRQQRGARMHPGPRPGQAVELEGVRQGPVGQRRRGCGHRRPARAEDPACAARPSALGVADDDPAPRQRRAADDRRHRIGDAFLGPPDDLGRDMLVAKGGRIPRQPNCFLRHDFLPAPLHREIKAREQAGGKASHQAASGRSEQNPLAASAGNLQRKFPPCAPPPDHPSGRHRTRLTTPAVWLSEITVIKIGDHRRRCAAVLRLDRRSAQRLEVGGGVKNGLGFGLQCREILWRRPPDPSPRRPRAENPDRTLIASRSQW